MLDHVSFSLKHYIYTLQIDKHKTDRRHIIS